MQRRSCHGATCPSILYAGMGLAVLIVVPFSLASDPWADEIVEYSPGTGAVIGYQLSTAALGPPERFSGEGIDPRVVSVFHPAWLPSEVVSIGAGGWLTLRFHEPVTDDPNHLYGIDLIVFGNSFFVDAASPHGICGSPAGLNGEGGRIEVSQDGEHWVLVPNIDADGLFPTRGYVDSGPYDTVPGTEPTDMTRPVDPKLKRSDFDGLTHAEIGELYYGSGGGIGVDIGAVGLTEVSYVRISNPAGSLLTPEVDAVAAASPRLPGDANLDGQVTIADVLMVISAFGTMPVGGAPVDMNNDGIVTISDVLVTITNFGSSS